MNKSETPTHDELRAAGYHVRPWVHGDFQGGERGDFVLMRPDGGHALAQSEEALWAHARKLYRMAKISLPNGEGR